MSLSKLPPECLNLILQVLQPDRAALSCLLQVNRSLCSAALPYIYHRALSWDASFDYGHGRPAIVHIPRLLKIIQLLLRRLLRKDVSELLCAAYDVDPDRSIEQENERGDSTEPLLENGIRYLSYIRAFDFEKVIYMTRFDPSYSDIDILQNYPRRLADYVFRSKGSLVGDMEENDQEFIAASGYGDGPHDNELVFPTSVLANATEAKLRHVALEASLRRELTWTLCSPVFEQIQEFSVPLSDLGRYLESVGRFSALTSISFIMDEPFLNADSDHGPGTTSKLSPDATESDKRRYQQLRDMIQFVERHERAFPGQLQFARCPSAFPCRVPMQCPGAVKNEISGALSMLARPTYIGHNNWRRVHCKLKDIDLGSVKTIRLLNQQNEAGTLFAKTDPTFLSRCRNLKSLDMDPLGAGSFQWAVEEKRAWDRYRSLPALQQNAHAEQQHLNWRSAPQLLPPIPLQTVAMLLNRRMLTDELDNIAFAFGDTLSHIQVFQCASRSSLDLPLEFRVGRDWKLPEIKTIAVSLVQVKLVVDPDFYLTGGLGPKVQLLQLVDRRTGPYRFQDVVSCRPVSNTLPLLTVIKLRGWPALTFHPESLRHTPNLQFLCLDIDHTFATDDAEPWTMEEIRASVFFAQEEEGEDENAAGESITCEESTHAQPFRRPLWTWDWHLPHLVTLALGPVFAYLFEFRMLESCPTVEVLELTLGSEAEGQQRVLSLQDFCKCVASSTSCHTNGVDDGNSDQTSNRDDHASSFIVASSIQDLTLAGSWIMDNSLRSVMFKTTFPNLEKLHERFTSGYSTWEGWVLALQRKDMPRLKEVSRWLNSMESDDGGEDGLTAVERTMKSHGMVTMSTNIQEHPMIIHGIMGQIRRLQRPAQLQPRTRKEGVEQEKQEETVYYLNARPWLLAKDALDTSTSE